MRLANEGWDKFIVRYFKFVYAALALSFGIGAVISLILGDEGIEAMAIPIGIMLLFAGLINSTEYIISPRRERPSPAVMAEGVTTVVIALFPLIEGPACVVLLAPVLELWELFSGSVKVAESIELRERQVNIWWLPITLGVLEILAGFFSLVSPVFMPELSTSLIIVIVLVMQCLGYVVQLILHGK